MLTSQDAPAKTQAIEELKTFIGSERDARQFILQEPLTGAGH